MKKLTLGFGVLFSGFAMNALAALPNSDVSVNIPARNGGFLLGLTGLYWRTSVPNEGFAVSFDEPLAFEPITFDQVVQQTGRTAYHLDPDHKWGFQANVGYLFPCYGYDLNLTFTHWNHSYVGIATDVLPSPGIATQADFIGPILPLVGVGEGPLVGIDVPAVLPLANIVDWPSFVPSKFVTDARSRQDFINHTWDLDFGHTIAINCLSKFHWYVGLRYSKLKYDLTNLYTTSIAGVTETNYPGVFRGGNLINLVAPSVFTYSGVFISNVAVNAQLFETDVIYNEFNGVGPRVGFDFNYGFCGGFGVTAGVATSLLVGEHRTNTSNDLQTQGIATFAGAVSTLAFSPGIDFPATDLISPATFTSTWDEDTGINFYNHQRNIRIVPNIDAKLGFNWFYRFGTSGRSKIVVEAGYKVSHYFNVFDFFEFPSLGDANLENLFSNNFNVTFDGPYASIQVAL